MADVRRDIDAAYAICTDLPALLEFVQWRPNAPEARLLAKAFILAVIEERKNARRRGPAIDLDWLNAVTAGLERAQSRSATHYGSLFDIHPAPGSPNRLVRRRVPLPARWPMPTFRNSND